MTRIFLVFLVLCCASCSCEISLLETICKQPNVVNDTDLQHICNLVNPSQEVVMEKNSIEEREESELSFVSVPLVNEEAIAKEKDPLPLVSGRWIQREDAEIDYLELEHGWLVRDIWIDSMVFVPKP